MSSSPLSPFPSPLQPSCPLPGKDVAAVVQGPCRRPWAQLCGAQTSQGHNPGWKLGGDAGQIKGP